ncbi:MAG: hypothetical protein IT581_07415 [Verrucomicrobiales bacterium]|nr:hypothetical protein [Verrucomicrobiales bacterium]
MKPFLRQALNRLWLAVGLVHGAWFSPEVVAQALPLEIRQDSIHYNLSSTNGLPISSSRGVPPGSDGRGPTLARQQAANLTEVPATTNQFRGFVSFGGVVRPAAANLGPSGNLAANAERLNLPRLKVDGRIVVTLLRGRVGAPVLGRAFSFLFGEVIPRPATDEYGVLLSTVNTNVTPNRPVQAPEDYWLAEPFTTNAHANARYYWSPHAQAVIAASPGPVFLTWRRSVASSVTNPPSGVGMVTVLGVPYVVLTNQYVVSGSPVKPPRLIYWTERTFANTGKPVGVPSARVGAVNVVYNESFPARVSQEVVVLGPAPIVTTNALPELRTLWYDETGSPAGGQIRAYNISGRVLVELLGDARGLGMRQHLGLEIVDVIQQPAPQDVTVELGERLTAYAGGVPGDADLFPEPLPLAAQAFTFRHDPSGRPKPDYYAIRETVNQNDLQVHWLEEGLEGLKWPFRFVRYHQIWPVDVARYSHYVRPLVATESDAKATAVPLPSQNAPFIDYQDPLDQPRGKLTENFAYYSFLDVAHPAHRALLRFTSGDFVRFERVFSWLDQGLRDANLTLPSFASDFSSAPGGASAYGNTYVADGYLHLIDALDGQSGGYVIDDFAGGRVVENFRVMFRARLGGSTSSAPADGFSFNFGTLPDGVISEEGVADGLVVSFDLFDNSGPDAAPGISIKLNGVTKAVVAMDGANPNPDPSSTLAVPRNLRTGQPIALTTGSDFVPVEIVLFKGGLMDVSYKGVKVLQGIQTDYVPRVGRFGLGARAGGANSTEWIDDLAIVLNDGFGSGVPAFAGSVATNLNSWIGNATFHWPDVSIRPRVVDATVSVGDRLTAPVGESGSLPATNYLAGFIRRSEGDLFHPGAYVDPFVGGFEAANRGAVIPVNAVPGRNRLEVWWFRENQVDATRGFQNSLWPSVIGRYTLQWPTAPSEIVLASDDGSGPLTSLQANGSIYYQNDSTQPGFNPNEEHALLQGGQAYALRDDLNVTATDGYTSASFVLLSYNEADGRPAVRTFKVLREKPEAGIVFDYSRDAGTILQPPMPLPLLEKPLAPNIAGQPPKSLNTEIDHYQIQSSTRSVSGPFTRHALTTAQRHFVKRSAPVALQNPVTPGAPSWFFPTNVQATTLEGFVSALRPLGLSVWGGDQNAVETRWRFAAQSTTGLSAGPTPALLFDPTAGVSWPVTVSAVNASYVEVEFGTPTPPVAKTASTLVIPVEGPAANAFVGQRLSPEPLPYHISDPGLRDFYGTFTLQDRKANIWFYRGPHTPPESPALVMQFYYRTLPGFFFPSLPLDQQPPVGTVTPYLRAALPNGSFEGDPVYGNMTGSDQEADGNALAITYRPVWPKNVPVLQMAETLTTPKRGLPAVRGQTSLQILYQQSQVDGDVEHESAVLHDPTREKTFALGAPANGGVLDGLPSSVTTQSYQGRTYFPNLPPHLAERLFLDPNRGGFGELIFRGEFVDAALGDKYVFLNVLGQGDAAQMKALCDVNDEKKSLWDAAIDGLSTVLETFIENPAKPGTYIPSAPELIGATEIARIRNGDVAADSYALTATGPGTGYLSLLAGNGRAFTPEGDPISVKIVRVVNTLYRGEVNIVESSNPLNEKLTLQQVVDLAAKVEDYRFEWKIASPVDGLPPNVYRNTRVSLLNDGVWSHLRFPLPADGAATVAASAPKRLVEDVSGTVSPISRVPYNTVDLVDGKLRFVVPANPAHGLSPGTALILRRTDGAAVFGTVHALTSPTNLYVTVDANQNLSLDVNEIGDLNERQITNGVQSIVFRQFTEPPGNYSQFWLSLDLDGALGAVVYLDGQSSVRVNTGTDDSTPNAPPGGLFSLSRVYRLSAADLAGGTLNPDGSRTHTIAVELISGAFPGQFLKFNVRLEAFASVDVTSQQWLPLDAARYLDGVRAVIGGTADVRSLADNYLIMRYQPKDSSHASFVSDGNGGNAVWSQWTTPQLAEGWIKRVLKGINPFNQRITDLFNNSVNTEVSLVAQAGARWEGDNPLNLEALNNAGLIEIYETVLQRGKSLSIGGGINFGPANDALLLAAGYLNDLYMVLGNEAWADASNPTIGIGTKDSTYGSIATSLFSFRGQLPTLLEEELALLRGRDDFLLPGVELRPVYNRMIWNYTRGIDAGEVVYALNYNILDQNTDGVVDAEDARRLYPQGHGDAYGHYLTALKGYYSLILDNNFDWVPRSEAVTVLGKPVSVDYQDERKFAAAAGALARTGKQVFDLTWRRDYKSGSGNGWSHFETTKVNTTTRSIPTTEYWAMDHWAARTGQGAFLNWVVGNAMLPDHDPDPTHAGSIQQIDRTTVPELKELPAIIGSLQLAMDSAEAGHTPLGLPSTTIPFDLKLTAGETATHFDQIFDRAKSALNNAIVAFDDAKDVTRLLRSEADSLADFRTTVNKQELAYTNSLIELYGTPYPDDIGPGRTYRTGFKGPDTIHYSYIDNAELTFGTLLTPETDYNWTIDTQTFVAGWADDDLISTFNFIKKARTGEVDGTSPTEDYVASTNLYISYTLSSHGFFQKPKEWAGQRASPGRVQQAISDIVKARNAAYAAFYWADAAKYDLDWVIASFDQLKDSQREIRAFQRGIVVADTVTQTARLAYDIVEKYLEVADDISEGIEDAVVEAIPHSLIFGLAAGGDLLSLSRGAVRITGVGTESAIKSPRAAFFSAVKALEFANETAKRFIEFDGIAPEQFNRELRAATSQIRDKVYGMNNQMMTINQRLQELDDAKRRYRSLLAEGDRIQQERQIFRQRSAAVIQGFRTRDAAFRIFRSEKLERYKALFDLAAQYAFMAAQAYDYETGLLHTDQGKDFISRIVRARSLGVVQNGLPQFAGSNSGDPGLSSALAEMYADWSVLRGRLGFNNPDGYGTTVSLRAEHFRILPGTNAVGSWKDVLNQARRSNLLDDPDVRRYCLQMDAGNQAPAPGLILEFSTTIAEGLNLFGRPLAAGDHVYSPSSFATKIFAAGVAFEGYIGMDDPGANTSAIVNSGGSSPPDPDLGFLDPDAMAATPYVYLVPVGVDSMRSPALGDRSEVRTWNVDDVAIPLPFNIGGSEYSAAPIYQSSDSLSERPFVIRKHQAFRPVPSASVFSTSIYTSIGLGRSQFTNNRLVGRSVWNSKWKLVIPGRNLLANPDEGLDRFIRAVNDIKLHFVTYSYSGN